MVQERFQSIISQLFQYVLNLLFVLRFDYLSFQLTLVVNGWSLLFRGLFVVVVLWMMIWQT